MPGPRQPWDGEAYQARFDDLARQGTPVHGEADLVASLGPQRVLDAGCGTGRVAAELARRGIEVVATDIDASMLATARRAHPRLALVRADLAELALAARFDVVVMAGNVVLFCEPGREAAVVRGAARHVGPHGALVSGFSLGHTMSLSELDRAAGDEGLALDRRLATWEGAAYEGGGYAVSIHHRA